MVSRCSLRTAAASHLLLLLLAMPLPAFSQSPTVEIHHRLVTSTPSQRQIALTLDACSGRFDAELIRFLIRSRIPATFFTTKKWLLRNPGAVVIIKAQLDLFDVENHGERHIPAVIGAGLDVYGIPAHPDLLHLQREVLEGARAIEATFGVARHWYRGATAIYDQQARDEIVRMNFKIAGFSLNADAGATLDKAAIEKRLRRVKSGDVIIAHMNHPESDTAEGLIAGLTALLAQGYVFVRLDQVELQELPQRPVRASISAP
jgi:peptidoglycan/xylan/chitin deacetylase (PgdA/CDA1 family)